MFFLFIILPRNLLFNHVLKQRSILEEYQNCKKGGKTYKDLVNR
jgi:hypothetical protein